MSTNPFDRQSPVPGIQHVILVGSGKGGVGKSTVALNLAVALKEQGLKIGLLDADIYGPSIPRLVGALHEKVAFTKAGKMTPVWRHGIPTMSMGYVVEEQQAVVWRGPMLFKAMDQFLRDVEWGELDVLVVDLPPGTGDVALTLAQKVPISGAVVVTTPQNLALVDAKKAIDMFRQLRIPLFGVIENMAYLLRGDDRIQLFPKGDLDVFLQSQSIDKLAVLPFAGNLSLSSEAGLPIQQSEPESEIAKLFYETAAKIKPKFKIQKKSGDAELSAHI